MLFHKLGIKLGLIEPPAPKKTKPPLKGAGFVYGGQSSAALFDQTRKEVNPEEALTPVISSP